MHCIHLEVYRKFMVVAAMVQHAKLQNSMGSLAGAIHICLTYGRRHAPTTAYLQLLLSACAGMRSIVSRCMVLHCWPISAGSCDAGPSASVSLGLPIQQREAAASHSDSDGVHGTFTQWLDTGLSVAAARNLDRPLHSAHKPRSSGGGGTHTPPRWVGMP